MTTVDNGGAQHAALASRTRREMLELIASSDEPLDATAIADRMELHVTTVRFHLDQLEAAHLLRRNVEREGRRGRPRVVYLATSTSSGDDSASRQLIEVLASALAEDPDGGRERGVRAGKQWAEALLGETPHNTDPIAPLMGVLSRVGFAPEPPTGGADGTIKLMACPFREAALDHPGVVCSVHRGLVNGTLEHVGHSDNEAILKPFVQPELCTVELLQRRQSTVAETASA